MSASADIYKGRVHADGTDDRSFPCPTPSLSTSSQDERVESCSLHVGVIQAAVHALGSVYI